MHARIGTVIALLLVPLAAGASSASSGTQSQGRLSGATQITFGCPGPQREGDPCERWSSFAQARFRLTRLTGTGGTRTVTSNATGRFTVLLPVGRYRLTPLPQAHTTGGTPVTVSIRVATTTWVRVRLEGFPQML
jgi:hypothetical protein